MPDINVTILKDSASPATRRLAAIFTQGSPSLRRDLMTDLAQTCATLTRQHVLANGTNKQNWPTTNFYPAVASKGVNIEMGSEASFTIKIDHPDKPGSMRQRYYGGTINMKDKLLTIPARQEFYGHQAGEFTNLRFGMFGRGGAKFLYIDEGGVGKVNFSTGKQHRVRGAGARAAMMVAYWLKESVFQESNSAVVPNEQDYSSAIMLRLAHHVDKAIHNN